MIAANRFFAPSPREEKKHQAFGNFCNCRLLPFVEGVSVAAPTEKKTEGLTTN